METQGTYLTQVLNWQAERDVAVRKENSWLALVGLYWLKLGKNRVGSASTSEVELPSRLPAELGYLDFNGKSVTLNVTADVVVYVNDKPTTFAIMHPDIADEPSFVTVQDTRLVIIQRGNRMGVRVWDNQSEKRKTFPHRTWYEVSERFRVPAVFTAYDRPKMAYFPDLTGEKSEFPVEGYLSFEFGGKKYNLDVNKEEDDSLFIRFWDQTSNDETYPTGRYLVADVEKDGKIFIDFNKAYCPPCAFTDFATCVFAPEQNHLDFRVTAGEMYPRELHK